MQAYVYPSSSAAPVNIASEGIVGSPAPLDALQVGGVDPSNNLVPFSFNSSGELLVDIGSALPNPLPVQDAAAEASLASIDGKLPSLGAHVIASSVAVNIASNQTVPVSAASLPLPAGAATEATLAAMSAKLPSPIGAHVIAASLAVNIASDQTVPVSAASLPLPSGAATEATLDAFSDKSASAFVSEPFDYQDISYVGVTSRIDQVIYKSGGSGGTVVATLTMGYDGSDRLTSVTRS